MSFFNLNINFIEKNPEVTDMTFARVCIRQACGTLLYCNFMNNSIHVQP